MTVSELKEKLQELEDEGKGYYKMRCYYEVKGVTVWDEEKEVEVDD